MTRLIWLSVMIAVAPIAVIFGSTIYGKIVNRLSDY